MKKDNETPGLNSTQYHAFVVKNFPMDKISLPYEEVFYHEDDEHEGTYPVHKIPPSAVYQDTKYSESHLQNLYNDP